jgi:hypothetical protein
MYFNSGCRQSESVEFGLECVDSAPATAVISLSGL